MEHTLESITASIKPRHDVNRNRSSLHASGAYGAKRSVGQQELNHKAQDEECQQPWRHCGRQLKQPHARRKQGNVLVALIYLLGLVMGALDMSIVNPTRTVIQNQMGVDDVIDVWVITIYTLAYAASIPVMGKLAKSTRMETAKTSMPP